MCVCVCVCVCIYMQVCTFIFSYCGKEHKPSKHGLLSQGIYKNFPSSHMLEAAIPQAHFFFIFFSTCSSFFPAYLRSCRRVHYLIYYYTYVFSYYSHVYIDNHANLLDSFFLYNNLPL